MGFAGNSHMMETATVPFEHVAYEQIASFYDEAWIADVLFPVKSGKEATVYCCRAHPSRGHDYFALKLYKPLAHRTFRDDAVYQEGRFGRETRAVRAMRKKTAKGRVFQFSNWIEHEFATLKMLFEAGADVPRPFAISTNAILLEFLGDGDRAAPPLSTVRLPPEQTGRCLIRHSATSRSCSPATWCMAIYPPTMFSIAEGGSASSTSRSRSIHASMPTPAHCSAATWRICAATSPGRAPFAIRIA